jgi:pimeloyl-ACP methyl ester carboxylesterase
VLQVVEELAGVLKLHSLEAAHFCAHSFGTFILARMQQLYPNVVKSALLCEPVRPVHFF